MYSDVFVTPENIKYLTNSQKMKLIDKINDIDPSTISSVSFQTKSIIEYPSLTGVPPETVNGMFIKAHELAGNIDSIKEHLVIMIMFT